MNVGALEALRDQWRKRAEQIRGNLYGLPSADAPMIARAEALVELADALDVLLRVPQDETDQEKKDDPSRVDSFPEGAHGDLLRRVEE